MRAIAKLFLLAAVTTATLSTRRDADSTENEITKKVAPKLEKLNRDLNGFPASGKSGANTIHEDSEKFADAVSMAEDDWKHSDSAQQDNTFAEGLAKLVPDLLDALKAFQNKEADYEDIRDLEDGGFLDDVSRFNTSFVGFTDKLVYQGSADASNIAQKILSTVEPAFYQAFTVLS